MISSRTLRTMILGMVVLALIGTGAALPLSGAEAADPPGSLLAYFGWPSQINGATTVDQAAAEFGRYDFVFLPGTTKSPSTGQLTVGVEDPSHPDHARTKAIIAHPLMANTRVFGYVNLGVTNGQLTLDQVRERIDLWRAMGADGIQLDAMGYDWEVTRTRQNNAVDYVHSLGMPVAANAWVPADVFGNEAIPVSNPNGVATRMGEGDYYMFESYWIRLGVPPTPGSADGWTYEYWLAKAQQLAAYQRQLGFGILSVTTNNPADVFSNALFDAAWDKAAEYGHTATGWGEYLFSADDNLAPFRPRPGLQAVCAGQKATIIGTALDDRLVGTEHPDVIAGLGGNDVIDGLGGDDLVCGGPGRDLIRGGAGADRLYGNAGPDRLLGQGGNDILIGGQGVDLARGGPGVDTCDAEQAFTCEG